MSISTANILTEIMKKLRKEVNSISIKSCRIARNLTQNELATKIGVKQSAISQWESETTKPTYGNLVELAQALDCSFNDLMKADEQ